MKEQFIYIVIYRPWHEDKGRYGEWANIGAFETREKAKSVLKTMALAAGPLPAIPNEYDIETLTFFTGK